MHDVRTTTDYTIYVTTSNEKPYVTRHACINVFLFPFVETRNIERIVRFANVGDREKSLAAQPAEDFRYCMKMIVQFICSITPVYMMV